MTIVKRFPIILQNVGYCVIKENLMQKKYYFTVLYQRDYEVLYEKYEYDYKGNNLLQHL